MKFSFVLDIYLTYSQWINRFFCVRLQSDFTFLQIIYGQLQQLEVIYANNRYCGSSIYFHFDRYVIYVDRFHKWWSSSNAVHWNVERI